MNAYELADEFKNRNWDEVDCVLWCERSANMLRQQADRIAELEKEKEELKSSSFDGADDSTNVSKNSITQPYAYAVVQGEDGKENVSLQFDHPEMCGQKYKQAIPLFTTPQNQLEKKSKPVAWMSPDGKVSQTEGNLFYIPLYTTPQTKPLSDGEIWNWFKENTALTKESALRIARAIEERHGIK